jgi:hypothetical protein
MATTRDKNGVGLETDLTYAGLVLSPTEAEVICSLKLPIFQNNEAQEEQNDLARKLACSYENGINGVQKNPWKATQYLAQGTGSAKSDDPFSLAKFMITSLGLFTSARLLFGRVNRIIGEYGITLLNNAGTKLLNIAGLSYFIDVVAEILDAAIRPETESEKLRSYSFRLSNVFSRFSWQHFKNEISDSNRQIRIFNDLLWGGINLLAFFVIGPTQYIFNLIGFGIDIFQEVAKSGITWRRVNRYDSLLEKVNNRITELDDKILRLKNDNNINAIEKQQSTTQIENEKTKLLALMVSLQKKQKGNFASHLYSVFTTSLLFTGMVLFYYPGQIAKYSAKKIGAFFACIAGSIIAGFGKRMVGYASDARTHLKNNSKKAKESSPPTISNSTADIRNKMKKEHMLLTRCVSLMTDNMSISETLHIFAKHNIKINELRTVLHLEKDKDWNRQMRICMENTHKVKPFYDKNHSFYHGSFKKMLLDKANEQAYLPVPEDDRSPSPLILV